MRRSLQELSSRSFDLAIIGGGVNGAATARDAALRGMKVALVEARDFAGGTSSRSSKLIHGGLRYLKQFELKLVREARCERRLLLNLAPHLARPVPFLLPIFQGDPDSALKIRLGLSLYDLLGNLGPNDRHYMMSRDRALGEIPTLRSEGLKAAAVYYDSETDDARLTLEYVLAAADHGAVVANYAEVRALEAGPAGNGHPLHVTAAEIEDKLTGRRYQLSARFWVNAAGPWVDRLRLLLPGYEGSKTVRLTKGTHIIIPPVSGRYALFAPIPPSERIFVLAPWHGHALLGTTDTDFDGAPETVRPDRQDAEYILRAINRVLRQPLKLEDVRGSFAGLRALVLQPGASPSQNTREYRFHEDPWIGNLITVCGGKLTTARSLGETLAGRVAARLGMDSTASRQPGRTTPFPGAPEDSLEVFVARATHEAAQRFKIPATAAERIARTYGKRWRNVLEPIVDHPSLAEPLPGDASLLAAEAVFAIEEEMAVTLDDFLLRRSGFNWFAPYALRQAAPAAARIFAERLGWTAGQREAALQSFAASSYNLLS
jgi:glycerol-3-phosphate dehydrogenase